nr:DNA cytosine methyltransferase [Nostoc commune]
MNQRQGSRGQGVQASPVCANFSQAHTASSGKGIETVDDLTAAIAVAEAIRQLQPRVFTLENVPGYQNSQSFSIILQVLESEGYFVNYSVVNMSDFGLPQARRRLVLIANKGFYHRMLVFWRCLMLPPLLLVGRFKV